MRMFPLLSDTPMSDMIRKGSNVPRVFNYRNTLYCNIGWPVMVHILLIIYLYLYGRKNKKNIKTTVFMGQKKLLSWWEFDNLICFEFQRVLSPPGTGRGNCLLSKLETLFCLLLSVLTKMSHWAEEETTHGVGYISKQGLNDSYSMNTKCPRAMLLLVMS